MDSLLTPSFTILPASSADLPTLGQVLTQSHISETIMPFFFPDWPRTDTLLPYMTARLTGKLSEPNSTFYKAVDNVSGAILGLVCMTLESGEKAAERNLTSPGGPGSFEPPPGLNWGFAKVVIEGLERLDGFMVGKRHFMVSSLAVDPKHHKKGLGKALMDHCHEIADEEGLPIYLTAFPGAHHLYLKWGYEDVEFFDVDLNEYGEKYRGFGVYRSWGMVRQRKGRDVGQ